MDSGNHYEQRIATAAIKHRINPLDVTYDAEHGVTSISNAQTYRREQTTPFIEEVRDILGLTSQVERCKRKIDALPDTGKRQEFGTGAVRDASEGKGHFRSIPPIALRKLAKRFEDGARKYADLNWQKGIALSAYYDSLTRHTLSWAEGDTSEDHAGAIIWNAACMTWTDEEIQAGRLPKELDDLPYRKPKTNQ